MPSFLISPSEIKSLNAFSIQSILRHPEVRKNSIFIIPIQRRKYQHESGNIRSGREVQTTVADAALQIIGIHRKAAGIPFLHRHPADCLLHPLVQAKLTEGVLLAGILLCRLTGGFDLIDANGDTEGGICFLLDLRVCPVVRTRHKNLQENQFGT